MLYVENGMSFIVCSTLEIEKFLIILKYKNKCLNINWYFILSNIKLVEISFMYQAVLFLKYRNNLLESL